MTLYSVQILVKLFIMYDVVYIQLIHTARFYKIHISIFPHSSFFWILHLHLSQRYQMQTLYSFVVSLS